MILFNLNMYLAHVVLSVYPEEFWPLGNVPI